MRRVRSIRIRLLLWLIVPLSLLAGAVSVETYFSARRVSDDLHDRTLQAVLLTLSEHMLANDNELVAENLLEVLTDSLGDRFFYHFVAPDNAWVIGYSGVPKRPAGLAAARGGRVFYDGTYQGEPVRTVAARQFARMRGVEAWTTLTVWQRVQQRRASTLALFTRSLWSAACSPRATRAARVSPPAPCSADWQGEMPRRTRRKAFSARAESVPTAGPRPRADRSASRPAPTRSHGSRSPRGLAGRPPVAPSGRAMVPVPSCNSVDPDRGAPSGAVH